MQKIYFNLLGISDRPKVPSVQHSAEPSVVNSTEAEPSVMPTERDLRLIEKNRNKCQISPALYEMEKI